MSKYNESAATGLRMVMNYLDKHMQSNGVTRYRLAKETGISQPTLARYFNLETDITLINLLKICGALDIRPYLVPAEMDGNEMQYIHFN